MAHPQILPIGRGFYGPLLDIAENYLCAPLGYGAA
jgi:hypothetical protein